VTPDLLEWDDGLGEKIERLHGQIRRLPAKANEPDGRDPSVDRLSEVGAQVEKLRHEVGEGWPP
jgi:hypothetical protein